MNAGAGNATTLARHHFDKLSRRFARFGIGTQQGYILLSQVGYLNGVYIGFVFQIDLYGVDNTSALCKTVCFAHSSEQHREGLCIFHHDTQSGQYGAYLFKRI